MGACHEKHKVISYPRTQCRYVSEEKAKEFPMMLNRIAVFDDLAPFVKSITNADIQRVWKDKKVVNTKEVEKESHDALLPTSNYPDLASMTDAEQKICNMIYRRLLAQFLPASVENKVSLLIRHGDRDFAASGKSVLEQGWRKLYRDAKDKFIPELETGQNITAKKMEAKEKVTTPPKRLTQSTLIAAMQNIANQIEDKDLKKSLADSKGIGTPATRASIITDIMKRGYVEEKKNALYITANGKNYVESMAEIDILSPVFAAVMDTEIKKIQRGESVYEDTYQKILSDLRNVCSQIDQIKGCQQASKYTCKKCGDHLTESKWYYKCSSCDFKVPKIFCGKQITPEMLDVMYSGKMTPRYMFKKKDGKTFAAKLKLTEEGIELDFSSGIICPYCGKEVRVNCGGVFCDCGLKVFNPIAGKKLSENDVKKLLKNGRLPKSGGFVSKAGNTFSAALVLKDKTIAFDFS